MSPWQPHHIERLESFLQALEAALPRQWYDESDLVIPEVEPSAIASHPDALTNATADEHIPGPEEVFLSQAESGLAAMAMEANATPEIDSEPAPAAAFPEPVPAEAPAGPPATRQPKLEWRAMAAGKFFTALNWSGRKPAPLPETKTPAAAAPLTPLKEAEPITNHSGPLSAGAYFSLLPWKGGRPDYRLYETLEDADEGIRISGHREALDHEVGRVDASRNVLLAGMHSASFTSGNSSGRFTDMSAEAGVQLPLSQQSSGRFFSQLPWTAKMD